LDGTLGLANTTLSTCDVLGGVELGAGPPLPVDGDGGVDACEPPAMFGLPLLEGDGPLCTVFVVAPGPGGTLD
jgi:hypothetical protein